MKSSIGTDTVDFGKNTALVREVLDFAEHGMLLHTPTGLAHRDWKRIRDFAEAKRLAWSQDSDAGDVPWVDLRESQMRAVFKEKYRSPHSAMVNASLKELLERMTALVSRRVGKKYGELLDDVLGDLHNCASQRAVCGYREGLIEIIFAAYRDGVWPCGWDGSYPRGRLIVYEP